MLSATKTIYILVGLPFSGKTTYAGKLASYDTLLIERDLFLSEIQRDRELMHKIAKQADSIENPVSTMFGNREANAINDVMTQIYVDAVVETIKETKFSKIVVDGTHLQPLSRSIVSFFPEAKRIAVVMTTPLEVCLDRLDKAKTTGIRSTVTPGLIAQMHDVFELPSRTEGFDEIEIINYLEN